MFNPDLKYVTAHVNLKAMVPTETGKPGKTARHFSVREKSGNVCKTGKVREFYSKYWKIENLINNLGEIRMFIGYLSTNISSLDMLSTPTFTVLRATAIQERLPPPPSFLDYLKQSSAW